MPVRNFEIQHPTTLTTYLMKTRKAIYLLLGGAVFVVLTWSIHGFIGDRIIREKIRIESPRMADGTQPPADVLDSFNALNQRFNEDVDWVERKLDPNEYPFTGPDFLDYLDSIASPSPTPVTYSMRLRDRQIMGVTYPKRLEQAVDLALRVMKQRSSAQGGARQSATRPEPDSDGGGKAQSELEDRSR